MKSCREKIEFDSLLTLPLNAGEWSASFSSHFPPSPPGCRPRPQSEWLCNGRILLPFPGNEPLYLLCYRGFYIHVSASRIRKSFRSAGWGCRGVLCFCVSPNSKWLSVYSVIPLWACPLTVSKVNWIKPVSGTRSVPVLRLKARSRLTQLEAKSFLASGPTGRRRELSILEPNVLFGLIHK